MFAIIETGGKQVRVEENSEIFVEKLDANEGNEVVFDKVLFVDGDAAKVGAPFIEGAKVTGKVVKQGKESKVLVLKYKSKKHYRKLQGHRQPYTKVLITKIEF